MHEKKVRDVEEKRKQEAEIKAKREQFRQEAKKKAHAEAKSGGAAAEEKKASEPAKAAAEPAADTWTAEQQKQMENGMREVPASVPTKERWLKIAEGVDGKSAKECFARYKELVAKAKAAK